MRSILLLLLLGLCATAVSGASMLRGIPVVATSYATETPQPLGRCSDNSHCDIGSVCSPHGSCTPRDAWPADTDPVGIRWTLYAAVAAVALVFSYFSFTPRVPMLRSPANLFAAMACALAAVFVVSILLDPTPSVHVAPLSPELLGNATCVERYDPSCAPFVCETRAGHCLASCSSHVDCTDVGLACVGGECVAATSLTSQAVYTWRVILTRVVGMLALVGPWVFVDIFVARPYLYSVDFIAVPVYAFFACLWLLATAYTASSVGYVHTPPQYEKYSTRYFMWSPSVPLDLGEDAFAYFASYGLIARAVATLLPSAAMVLATSCTTRLVGARAYRLRALPLTIAVVLSIASAALGIPPPTVFVLVALVSSYMQHAWDDSSIRLPAAFFALAVFSYPGAVMLDFMTTMPSEVTLGFALLLALVAGLRFRPNNRSVRAWHWHRAAILAVTVSIAVVMCITYAPSKPPTDGLPCSPQAMSHCYPLRCEYAAGACISSCAGSDENCIAGFVCSDVSGRPTCVPLVDAENPEAEHSKSWLYPFSMVLVLLANLCAAAGSICFVFVAGPRLSVRALVAVSVVALGLALLFSLFGINMLALPTSFIFALFYDSILTATTMAVTLASSLATAATTWLSEPDAVVVATPSAATSNATSVECAATFAVACFPFTCDVTAAACKSVCASDAECFLSTLCIDGVCQASATAELAVSGWTVAVLVAACLAFIAVSALLRAWDSVGYGTVALGMIIGMRVAIRKLPGVSVVDKMGDVTTSSDYATIYEVAQAPLAFFRSPRALIPSLMLIFSHKLAITVVTTYLALGALRGSRYFPEAPCGWPRTCSRSSAGGLLL
ncbi:uncharacterized protein AMSG_03164 [Thecamonas trahens ATCC 50062]|uniref:Uncharacterized protein n=1 Tax=Thecamonas trahens ATCC 50062 TaxID=461836 RepID=A0A0L0D3K4_THETB|nr:hypothetical protein AMSG_03164 [Thecamonas trahens ATCC 50062]KNC46736.1 hypothetical protein AMSG_03164 [Thecamonas trahens ATCC 50062]|eukprot:XP_013760016.1 hypothetical protein AMSG_03164 [Thecamonas trahens ATCC 50062]